MNFYKFCFIGFFIFCLFFKVSFAKNSDVSSMEKNTIELHMKLPISEEKTAPRVALTFDLCDGKTDYRILNTLIKNKIKATLFLTQRWIKSNPQNVALLKEHLDLFEIENHGEKHIPAVDNLSKIYGLKTAGSLKNIYKEVYNGNKYIEKAGFPKTKWYRTAAARYSPSAIKLIEKMNYKIAGFSINGDEGTTLSREKVYQNFINARNADVIIAHMNHPEKSSGAGVVEGILFLKLKGYNFVKLSDVF